MKVKHYLKIIRLHLLLMFLFICFTSSSFAQLDFSRDDNYDFTGKHYLQAFGTDINNFNINIESSSDFHKNFKLRIIRSRLKLGAIYNPYQYRVDMNNDGSWEQNWTSSNDKTVSFNYPNPTNGISQNYTIKVEIKYVDTGGSSVNRTKHHQVTVFSTPKVYVNPENDVFVQLKNEDCSSKIPVLFVEGFDPLNDKFPETYYNLTWNLVNTDLYPNNFEVFILNFNDGGRDLRLNADVLMKCLDKIHEICPNYQIAVSGLSMGGPIARYALAEKEELGGNHNVGLFMSYDSPQDGAHTNPSLQDWIKGEDPNEGVIGILQSNLNSTAAKQMLRYNTYDPTHIYRNEFYSDLNGLNGDGYPHKSHNVAVGNGNLQATHGNGSIGRHLLTLRVNDQLIHDVAAVEFDCETGSKMTDITMTRYADIFSNPFIDVWYELSIIFNPSYIPTWSGLDLVNWQDDSFGNIISFDHSKFDDYILQTIPLEHHELSTLTRNKIMDWLDLDLDITVNYDLLNGGTANPDNYQVNILHGISINVQSKNVNVNGKEVIYNFLEWEDSNTNNPRTFYTSHDALHAASLKGDMVSGNSSAYNYNNQHKLVRTENGIYYSVYEDNYGIWLASSQTTDFNGSWNPEKLLVYNEQPGTESYYTNPSIDFYDNKLAIGCELCYPNGSDIIHFFYDPITDNLTGHFIDWVWEPESIGLAKPVVAYTYNKFWIVWYSPEEECIKYYAKEYNGEEWVYDIDGAIPFSNNSSTNPTITCSKKTSFTSNDIFIAWQQGISEINYIKYDIGTSNFTNFETISTGSGFTRNQYPSISTAYNRYPVVSWKGSFKTVTEGGLEKPADVSMWQHRAVVRPASKYGWYNFYNTGDEIDYSNCNSTKHENSSIIAFSQNEGATTKYIKRQNNVYSVAGLSHSGIQTQVSNGSNLNSIKAAVFNNSGEAPYLINKSTTDFGFLNKATAELPISSGRKGVVVINGVEFVFYTGDIQVEGQNVSFVDLPDTFVVNSLPTLNESMYSQPFALNSGNEILFSNFYYVINYDSSDTLLSVNNQVHFKLELVKENTNETIATYDDIVYSSQNLEKYENKNYLISCSGIEQGNYYFRLITEVNGNASYFLSNIHNDPNQLAKRTYIREDLNVNLAPSTYQLKQNYPNPFNPVTNIYFELPNQGKVNLTIYDIRGRIVNVLVNDQMEEGRYSVPFDGSNLASGVYFYEIVATNNSTGNNFRQVKKMMLVK